jgi:hypothetical protein
MIDIDNEQLRLLTKASADVPGTPHVSTLIRWALRGLKGIKLETVVVGGRRYTSVEAIRRFLARLNEPRSASRAPLPERRQQEVERAERRLDAEGIG